MDGGTRPQVECHNRPAPCAPPTARPAQRVCLASVHSRSQAFPLKLSLTPTPSPAPPPTPTLILILTAPPPSFQCEHTPGFLTLQRVVDEFAFDLAADYGAARLPPPSGVAWLAPFPTAAYSQNPFYLAVQFLLPLILPLCQLFPVALLAKSVVEEKELRLAQTSHIMGAAAAT